MKEMSFAGSQPPRPYPFSVRLRWIFGRAVKWAGRALALLGAVAAMAWTGVFVTGCSGLKTTLTTVTEDPALAYSVPKDWEKPAGGENGAPYFASSFALMSYAYPEQAGSIRKAVAKGWEGLAEDQREKLKAWLKDRQLAFDLATKGAEKSGCRYSREWWSDQARTMEMEPWRVPVPELEGAQQMSEALVALAQGRAAEGKFAEAREAIRVAIAVADSLRDDPFLQSQARRVSLISMIMDNVTDLVPATLSPEDLEAWIKIIPSPDRFDGALERAGMWLVKERVDLFRGSPDRYWFWQRIYYRWGPMDLSKYLRKRLADPLFEADAIRCLEDTRRLVAIWKKPYLEAKAEAASLEREWKGWKESRHPTAPLVWHVAPSLRLERLQMARARCAMVKLGLEWELARAKTGAYPKTAEAVDPMTGQAFRLEEGPARLTGAIVSGRSRRPSPPPQVGPDGKRIKVPPEPTSLPNTWVLRAK